MNLSNLSPLCFGCEPLGGTDWGNTNIADIENAVKEAVALGINFFDTAAIYGLSESEKRLAQALGTKRHDVIIATKGGLSWSLEKQGRAKVWRDSAPGIIRDSVFGSLKRMKLDVIPIYFIHWPDTNTSFKATFSELQKLKDDGLIKAIGCSNFTPTQLFEAMKYAQIKYVQGPLNLFMRSCKSDILTFCKQNKLDFIAYNSLASGLLTGKFNSYSKFPKNDRRSRLDSFNNNNFKVNLKRIEDFKAEASIRNISILPYALQWVLEQPSVRSVITGIKSSDQLIMNWDIVKKYNLCNLNK